MTIILKIGKKIIEVSRIHNEKRKSRGFKTQRTEWRHQVDWKTGNEFVRIESRSRTDDVVIRKRLLRDRRGNWGEPCFSSSHRVKARKEIFVNLKKRS